MGIKHAMCDGTSGVMNQEWIQSDIRYNVGKTITKTTHLGMVHTCSYNLVMDISGDLGDGLLLFYPHYMI